MPVSVTGKAKLQARDYKPAGRFPVVDQGQERIAGWTDDESAVISEPLPLIVFGDHTRSFKFIDQPFARGADGTQLLRPRSGIDPLFFFYACKALDLPARGYNRHFTALKEKQISYPDKTEQVAIGGVLRRIDFALEQQITLIDNARALKQAVMRELFGCGLRGEPKKETEIGPLPQGWQVVSLGSIGKIGNGTTPNRQNPAYWHGGTLPWITSGRMYERRINGADSLVTNTALEECSLPLLRPGAVLIAIVGQGKTLGHCAILDVEATVSRHVGFIQPKESVICPGYLRGFLESRYEYLRQLASGNGSTRGALTCAILRNLRIPLPSIEEQQEIVAILDTLDLKIDLQQRKRAVLENLFKTLLHKLMTGEIGVNELALSALNRSVDTTMEVTV
ncbi:restriction endonuclease subunit S [Massilia haematophila]|uniref:Restriction endonuclease subunit S n=1 Tax=Massilia haematophila TaxID=457923 RepID=A0ABV7PNI3_9BURK